AKVISEKDSGMFEALNKGIRLATGDIVGILNSDDFFTSTTVVEQMVHAFGPEWDAIIGDVAFVNTDNLKKIVRYYSSKRWRPSLFKWGFMPPHPSFYLRRARFEQ